MMTARIARLFSLVLAASAKAVEAANSSNGGRSSRHPDNRSLQSNAPITEDQYQACLKDILTADQNGDYELNASEFIRFVTFNSAAYGYTWGYAAGQTSLDKMPLNFPMLFYSQACLCAHEGESFGCCSADKAHVDIYAGPQYGGGITEKQDIYMREFCTEAYHSYSVTLAPTPMPTPMPTTASPTLSPVVITLSPTPLPTPPPSPPPTPLSTSESTPSPTTSEQTPSPTTSTTSLPTPSGTTSILPVTVQYGISSDCGVTAFDVMTANGNTIKAGLETATEVAVIETLNTTSWPWEGTPLRIANLPKKVGLENNVVAAAESEEEEVEVEGVVELPHLLRYYELVPVQKSNMDDVGGGVTYMLLNHQRPRRQRLLHDVVTSQDNHQHQHRFSRRANMRRNLVYYTENNVEITDVEDSNQDQACPPGLNCMIVYSTIRVVLEPGDDPDIVRDVIEEGLEASYQDGSFFQGIPEDTVLCPDESQGPSASPTVASGGSVVPTPSIASAAPSSLSSVESIMPSSMASNGTSIPTPAPSVPSTLNTTSSMPSSLSSGTATPSASASGSISTMMPSTTATGNETQAPSMITSSSSLSPSSMASDEATVPSAMPSPSASSNSTDGSLIPSFTPNAQVTPSPTVAATLQRLQVTINYDIENQCGLDAEKVMNEDGNTLKTGLIAATTTVAIDTLNATFPREESQRNMRGIDDNYDRNLAYIEALPDPTNRVYYTDEYPVIIERILDIETGCDPGTNCLLIISTVTVVMEAFDDENAVKKAITDGISQSFRDGSFNSAIPPDTIICPTRGGIKFIPPEPARLRARKR